MSAARTDAWAAALAPVIEGVRVVSATAFVSAGRRHDAAEEPPASREDDFFDPDPLMHRLHRHLYAEHYAAPPEDGAAGGDGVPGDAEFAAALHAANAGVAARQEGWRVVETLRGGSVAAERGHRARRWVPGEYLFDGAPEAPRKGDTVAAWRGAGTRTLQRGFYYALGAAAADGFDEARLVRYYFNLGPATAASAVALLTAELGRRGLPFAFKCPDRPAAYGRRDSGVLYVAARHAQVTHAVLHAFRGRLAPLLRAGTPLLALPLAGGLAFAQDPPGGESFGAHRTRAVAEALVAAWRAGEDDAAAVHDRVRERFAAHGIDPAAPHLTADPADTFGLRRLELA